MQIINYNFIEPRLLGDILCKLLILYNYNYCFIEYDDYCEIHFLNYIVRINHNENEILFDKLKFLNLISNYEKKYDILLFNKNICYVDFNISFNDKFDLSSYENDFLKNKYKNVNYISKKKLIKMDDRKNKSNTRRK